MSCSVATDGRGYVGGDRCSDNERDRFAGRHRSLAEVHSKRNCDACRRLTRWRSCRPSNARAARSLSSPTATRGCRSVFRAARSHAGDKAPPDQVQRNARFGTGDQCARPRTGRDGCGVCRQRRAAGRRADRDGLRRASIRQFRSSAWRWPRYPPRLGPGPQRRAAQRPIEGRGQDAVLAARRRPRRIGAGPARISRQRSDACARNSDHTGAGGGLNR